MRGLNLDSLTCGQSKEQHLPTTDLPAIYIHQPCITKSHNFPSENPVPSLSIIIQSEPIRINLAKPRPSAIIDWQPANINTRRLGHHLNPASHDQISQSSILQTKISSLSTSTPRVRRSKFLEVTSIRRLSFATIKL